MKIALGADHAGFELKERLRHFISQLGHEVSDLGTDSQDSVDYPDYARAVASLVASGGADRGLLVCGTGTGMAIAANKVNGIRAAACNEPYSAAMARAHNDANILTLGSRVAGCGLAEEIVARFLTTDFEGGRHQVRLDKFADQPTITEAAGGGTP